MPSSCHEIVNGVRATNFKLTHYLPPHSIAMDGAKVQNVDVGFERIRACVARMHLLLRIDLDDGD